MNHSCSIKRAETGLDFFNSAFSLTSRYVLVHKKAKTVTNNLPVFDIRTTSVGG